MKDRSGGSWTRDEREVAINDVFSLCLEIADHCDDAVSRLSDEPDDSGVAALFARIASRRRAQARRLERLLRVHDELPDEPDPDAEVAHRAVEWVKTLVADDRRRALLEARLEHEERLEEAIGRARALDLPPDAARCLDEIEEDGRQTRARLREALGTA